MNKWRLNKIPKILHVYWGGKTLPYIRYMTVRSFMKYNPEWEVYLWYPDKINKKITWMSGEQDYEVLCKDYLPELMLLPVKKNIVNFKSLGFPAGIAEVHKADYIRINVLRLYGGVWADMDILFFRPLNELKVNIEINKDKEIFVCRSSFGHSTGFLMAAPESQFFQKLSRRLSFELKTTKYQCIGPNMFDKYFPTIESINIISPAVNMDTDVVYAHDSTRVMELLNGTKTRFTRWSIGCHWYGGNRLWGSFMRETNGGLVNLKNNIIGNILKNGLDHW